MARKTVVHTTNAEVGAAEYKADARKDIPRKPSVGIDTGLITLAELRERRGALPAAIQRDDGTLDLRHDSLLKRAQDAARLELRGDKFSPDDRADVAATIVADILTETGGAPPRADSDRVSLTACCDRVKTLRRSIERQRERDSRQARERAAAYANSAHALGIDPVPAKFAPIVARSGVAAARRAATAICAELGLDVADDSPAWTVLYQWARGGTGETCAAELGVSWNAFKIRAHKGAKFLRGFYSSTELLRRLTLGAVESGDEKVFVIDDLSREAGSRTRCLADRLTNGAGKDERAAEPVCWREPSYERPADAAAADAACEVRRTEKVHHMSARKARGDVVQHRADALRALGRAHAATSRRERAAARKSNLRNRHTD